MFGLESANFSHTASTALPSVVFFFKNFRLAGVFSKMFSTMMVVPSGQPGVLGGNHLAEAAHKYCADFILRPFGQDPHGADGGNGGKCFAAEAERADGFQIASGFYLAGRMAENGFWYVLARHAAAVVGDAHKRRSTVLDFDGDGTRTGVGAVFEHFLDGGCRTFDHFTGGQ